MIPASAEHRFTLVVNDPAALRVFLTPPIEINAGRAFVAGLLDCEGNIEALIDMLYRRVHEASKRDLAPIIGLITQLPKSTALQKNGEAHLRGRIHSLARDRDAIGFHYDHPVEFYGSFLDPQMVYSCAYYDDGVTTLAQAQTAKMDHLLRKLRLKPGDRLLDIGCGWGALVIRAVQRFGARAVGVTLSRVQQAEGERRIRELGLRDSATVKLCDYRELTAQEPFDKIVSVGMFEHVGREKLPEYFGAAFAMLRPGGLFANHGIADQSPGRRGGKIGGFVERFVFPDGELVAFSDALGIAERVGFEVRDVENLREHYARTLREWVLNLERNRTEAIQAAGERTYRVWRLYMAGSAQGFASGRLGIFQALLAKPDGRGRVDVPATRRDLYR
ncbi:MAG: class I SAM-dependent methyltransferase [Candidatus Eremiobacteraeota bacterium]|nr:class I SAM-dependent methyltransferase [Candidatus Eremiobacteraeota bacterium]MBC5826226.1 class I SAM-dependent methyltransferase [Candidatus Eremiobacteraeota bacterium]